MITREEMAEANGIKKCPACLGNDADMPCAYPSARQRGCLRDKRLAAAKAPQSVVGDERAAFEAKCIENAGRNAPLDRSETGAYRMMEIQAQWVGWNARATLSAQQIAALRATIAELETMLAAVGAGGDL